MVPFEVDSGAEIEVMPLSMINKMNKKSDVNIVVQPSIIKLKPFVGKSIAAYGECFLTCSYRNGSVTSRIAIVDEDVTPILGYI